MPKVLIVDDEQEILNICRTYFQYEGYEVHSAQDGEAALNIVDMSFDLLVLDIMMPKLDGYEVVQRLADRGINIPYIYLTAKVTENDTIYGLMIGADDYIKKPFSPKELVIRANKIIERNKVQDFQEILTYGRMTINVRSKGVLIDDVDLCLRQKEYELLYYLAKKENAAISKSELLENVWGYNYAEDMNTVNVHIHRIREKLESHNYEEYTISTVWGLGYKFERMK